jgi:hypothetical protein
MAIRKQLDLVVDQKFDRKVCRHYFNGSTYVLHCHHYATLYCRLADDAELFDGKALLRKGTEAAFVPEMRKFFEAQGVCDVAGRVQLVEEYWRFMGMGLVRFERVGAMAATAVMTRSHVDEGWVKKWGNREAPVNFIGQGFLAAAMAAIYEVPEGSYAVQEQQSIVAGAEASVFTIVRQ